MCDVVTQTLLHLLRAGCETRRSPQILFAQGEFVYKEKYRSTYFVRDRGQFPSLIRVIICVAIFLYLLLLSLTSQSLQ